MTGTAGAMGRRSLLVTLAVVGGLLVVGALASVVARRAGWRGFHAGGVAQPAGAGVRAYFGPLSEGTKVGRFTIVHLYDPVDGAIPVVLAGPDGHRFELDLLRLDPPGPLALASTGAVALYVPNAGDGHLATPLSEQQGAMALREALLARELAGATAPALVTMRERMAAPRNRTDGIVVPLDP